MYIAAFGVFFFWVAVFIVWSKVLFLDIYRTIQTLTLGTRLGGASGNGDARFFRQDSNSRSHPNSLYSFQPLEQVKSTHSSLGSTLERNVPCQHQLGADKEHFVLFKPHLGAVSRWGIV